MKHWPASQWRQNILEVLGFTALTVSLWFLLAFISGKQTRLSRVARV